MLRPTLLLLLTLCLLAPMGGASYLQQDFERTAPDRPPPERPRTDPIRRVIQSLRVREGCTYRRLTIFLLELDEPEDPTPYTSVQQALAAGVLDVRESQQDNISALRVRNRGTDAVLMLAGEVLLGGKQNRILRDDVLLSPRSDWVRVPVACVEERRWSRQSRPFQRRIHMAPLQLRAASQSGRSQDGIWHDIRGYHERFGVESKSRDLAAIRDTERVRQALRDYRRHFGRHCWRPETVGMVVARRGRIVGADIFCNARVFRQHRDRLLDSYAIDCIAPQPRQKEADRDRHPIGGEDARHFLRRTLRAAITHKPGHGSGFNLTVSGEDIRGAGIIRRRRLLHAALYPRIITIPPSPPRPHPSSGRGRGTPHE
jgi:hypothetical protein